MAGPPVDHTITSETQELLPAEDRGNSELKPDPAKIKIAACVLVDAMYFRHPACRLTVKRCKLRKWLQWIVTRAVLIFFCLLLLCLNPLMENQDSFTFESSDYIINIATVRESQNKFYVPSIVVESVILLILSIDCTIRCILAFPSSIKQLRRLCGCCRDNFCYMYLSEFILSILYIFAIALSWFSLITSIILMCCDYTHELHHSVLFVRQLVRPFFVIAQIQLIRKVIKAIALSFLALSRILVLLVLMIFIFATLGLVIFPRHFDKKDVLDEDTVVEGDLYFKSILQAYWSLLVYLTTSNSPDVLTPAYEKSRWYFIYFGTYFLICHYFIFKFMTALLAANFLVFFKKSVQRSHISRLINLKIVFEILKKQDKKNNYKVSLQYLDQLLKEASLTDIVNETGENAYAETGMDWNAFKQRCLKILKQNTDFKKPEMAATDLPEMQDETAAMDKTTTTAATGCRFSTWYSERYSHIANIVYICSFLLALTHMACLTTLLILDFENSLRSSHSTLAIATLVFSCLLSIEFLVRTIMLLVQGCTLLRRNKPFKNRSSMQKYFCNSCSRYRIPENVFNFFIHLSIVLDLFVLLTIVILGFIHAQCASFSKHEHCFEEYNLLTLIRITVTLVLLRLLRMIVMSKIFSNVLHTLFHAAMILLPLGLLVYIFYYVFAILGIYFFEFEIKSTANMTFEYNNFSICVNGTYESLKYHPYNFQDFFSSLVTLWNLMVVNNWFIIVEAYVCRTSQSSGIFFVIWWFLTETILNSILFGALLYIVESAFNKLFYAPEQGDTFSIKCRKFLQAYFGCSCILDCFKCLFGNHTHNKNGKDINSTNDSDKSGFDSLLNTWNLYEIVETSEDSIPANKLKDTIKNVFTTKFLDDAIKKHQTTETQATIPTAADIVNVEFLKDAIQTAITSEFIKDAIASRLEIDKDSEFESAMKGHPDDCLFNKSDAAVPTIYGINT